MSVPILRKAHYWHLSLQLLVVSFGEAEFASTAHFLVGVSSPFHAKQNSIRHL